MLCVYLKLTAYHNYVQENLFGVLKKNEINPILINTNLLCVGAKQSHVQTNKYLPSTLAHF